MNDEPRGQVKSDRLLDHTFRCKSKEYPNLLLLTIVDSVLIANEKRDNIQFAPN